MSDSFFNIITIALILLGFYAIFKRKNILRMISFGLLLIFLLFGFFLQRRPEGKISSMDIPVGGEFILDGQLGFNTPERTIKENTKWFAVLKKLTHRDSLALRMNMIRIDDNIRNNSVMSNHVFVDSVTYAILRKFNYDSLIKHNEVVKIQMNCVKLSDTEWEQRKLIDFSIKKGRTIN